MRPQAARPSGQAAETAANGEPAADPHPGAARVGLCLGLVLLAALALRLLLAPQWADPVVPDDLYYWQGARNIATGRGMVIDIAWQYTRGVPDALPMPSHDYWMPLASWAIVPFMKLLGPGYAAAQACGIFWGLALTALAFLMAWSWFRSLPAAALAGLLIALGHRYAFWSCTGDTLMVSGVALGAALWCMSIGLGGRTRYLIWAGLLTGLAHLTRNDAALALVTLVVSGLWLRRRGASVKPISLLYFIVPYALVIAPWLIRQHLVFGSALGPGLTKLAALTTYADLYRVDLDSVTFGRLFATRTIGELLHVRWKVFLAIGSWVLSAVHIGLYYLPAHAWRTRFNDQIPFIVHWALIGFVYVVILPYHAAEGSYFRAATGLYAYFAVALAGGLFRQIGRQREAGDRARLTWMPLAAGCALLLIVSHHLFEVLPAMTDSIYRHPYYAYRADLEKLGPELGRGPLISDDPWRVFHVTGAPCYMLPSDGAGTTLELAHRVGARHVIVRGGYRGKAGLDPDDLAALPAGSPRLQLIARLVSEKHPDHIDVLRTYRLSPRAARAGRRAEELLAKLAPQRALSAFRRAVELQGEDGSAPFELGIARCLLDLNRPQEAVPHLRTCLRLDPDSAGAHYYSALCLEQLGRREAAWEHFLETWKLDPDEARWPEARQRLREPRPTPSERAPRRPSPLDGE